MKIICIGRNYAAHAEELNHQIRGGAEDPAERSRQAGGGADTLPERNRPGSGECSPEPIWFLKPDTALLRNNDPFYIPAFSHEVHYECELVVRIDRVGKSIAERFAHRYYKEVGLGIDFTARRPAAAGRRRRSAVGAQQGVRPLSGDFAGIRIFAGAGRRRAEAALHAGGERPDPPDGRHAADALYGGPHHRRRIAVHDPAHGRFDLHRGTPAGVGTGQPRATTCGPCSKGANC